MKAVVFLADGFEECEALIVVDILRRSGIETVMVSTMGRLEVKSSRDVIVKADVKAADETTISDADLVFLPGGRLGTDNLAKSEIVTQTCLKFSREKKRIAAICAAPSILAGLGFLEGKEATCHPDYENNMHGAILTHQSVTAVDNIITGQGLGATFEFAFKLVEVLTGKDKVRQIKDAICYKNFE